MHLVQLETVALRFNVIRRPGEDVLLAVKSLPEIDRNNPTVYQIRADFHSATGNQDEMKKDILKIIKIIGKDEYIKRFNQ